MPTLIWLLNPRIQGLCFNITYSLRDCQSVYVFLLAGRFNTVVLHLVAKETYVRRPVRRLGMVPCWLFLILGGCCYGSALRLEDTPSSKKRSIT